MIHYYSVVRIRYEYRRSQVGGQLGTVYAIIYVEGQKEEPKSTGIRCTRPDYDARSSAKRSAEAKQVNEQLVLWERSILSAARSLTDRGEPVTPTSLLDEKKRVNQPLLTLENVYELFDAHKKTLVGHHNAAKRMPHQIHADTYHSYKQRWAWVRRFLAARKEPKILLLKVDAPLVQKFYYYLSQQGLGAAYATKCVKLLTEVCQWAFNAGHIRELKTVGFRGSAVSETPPYNVTEAEVMRIEALDLPTSMGRVRDGWLLARELCLHYADYCDIKERHFSRDSRGRLIFEKPRVKQESGRNIKIVSLVSPRAQAIWERYNHQIPVRFQGPHMGRMTAEIGQRANLPQRLKFSHARDSGIFKLITAGKSEIEIKLAAGWTSMRQLIRYVNHDRLILEQFEDRNPPPGQTHQDSGRS